MEVSKMIHDTIDHVYQNSGTYIERMNALLGRKPAITPVTTEEPKTVDPVIDQPEKPAAPATEPVRVILIDEPGSNPAAPVDKPTNVILVDNPNATVVITPAIDPAINPKPDAPAPGADPSKPAEIHNHIHNYITNPVQTPVTVTEPKKEKKDKPQHVLVSSKWKDNKKTGKPVCRVNYDVGLETNNK
jgi:hypothetical protein